MNRTFLIGLFALGACAKPPPEAPKELGDLGAFLFANFEAEDTAELGAGFVNLRELVLKDDLTLDAKDRAVTMPILKGDDLGGLSQPAGVSPDEQIPIALSGLSVHPLDDQRAVHVEPNQICIESSSTKWAQREFLTDDACWADGSCDRLETLTEVYKQNPLAKIWYDQYKTYRHFEVETEDGEVFEVIAGQAWIEQKFEAEGGGGNSWDQLFQLDVAMEHPDKAGQTLRWFSMWSSITLGGLTDDGYSQLVVSGIDEAYVYGDEFIEGVQEACTNDRSEPKPDRTN